MSLEYAQDGVFIVTPWIFLGRFADQRRLPRLHKLGITHILNVTEGPAILSPDDGFKDVRSVPIDDLTRIPDKRALQAIQAFADMAFQPEARLYIHCAAGQNRSPTILWLFLLACGLTEDQARDLIEAHNLDAIPGHPRLIDPALVKLVKDYGLQHWRPLPRPELLMSPP